MPQPKLILASTSNHRAKLLQQYHLEFTQEAPDVEEDLRANEAPAERAKRLAQLKCASVARRFPDDCVLGSDQVGVCSGELLHKPGSFDRALEQLQRCQGQTATFHTAVSVWNPQRQTYYGESVPTTLKFKTLKAARLAAYLRHDEPYDCAGAFKAEATGLVLFDAVSSEDPTALVGLPMMAVLRLLARSQITPGLF